MEAVSQLDRDASIAVAAIREWRNSFALVNRIPTDIITLIPTHLPTQKDRFHAASVCRHWRGDLLEHGALWSQLFLRKGEECVSTLLKRAKGSALDIIINRDVPVGTITLVSPRARQIKYLEFTGNDWQDIISFSESNSEQLPLLHTLKIIHPITPSSHGQPNVVTFPSLPIFRSSVNLEQFFFDSWEPSHLSHFIFPNLTKFDLQSYPGEECNASHLLDFLRASPTLQIVELKISGAITLGDDPEEMAVLPNVKTFSLLVADGPTTHVHKIAAHISRPCATHTSLINRVNDTRMSLTLRIFPTLLSWNTIVHQHTISPVEEVTLEIQAPEFDNIKSFLTFQASDATVVRLGFNIIETGVDRLNMPRAEMGWEIFSQALTTIQEHPLLSHLKRLHIQYNAVISDPQEMVYVAEGVRELFGLLGPLDELTIRGCDLHVFLSVFLDDPGLDDSEQSVVFPQVKKLTILHPMMEDDEVECMNAIVELAESQHTQGMPFERVTVRTRSLPAGMAEELGRWVSVVDCCEEQDTRD